MSTEPLFPEAELDETRDAIINSLAKRGPSELEDSRAGCIIRTLFAFYKSRAFRPNEVLWKDCWKDDPSPEYGAGEANKVRKSILRAASKMRDYFLSQRDRYQYRLALLEVLGGGMSGLRCEPNDPDPEITALDRDGAIGLLFGRADEWFARELMQGVEFTARAAGKRVVVVFSSLSTELGYDDPTLETGQLLSLSQQCAGLVVVSGLDEFARGATDLTAPYRRLIERRYPLVFADHAVPDCKAPLVRSDNEKGGSMATQYLVEELQCKEVYVVAAAGSQTALDRIQGHVHFMQTIHGTGYTPTVIRFADNTSERIGYSGIDQFLHYYSGGWECEPPPPNSRQSASSPQTTR